MRNYDIILMDADDTLFDFVRAEENALRRLFALHGIDWTDEKVRTYQRINDGLWKQFETGAISKAYLLDNRFALFFEAVGVTADGVQANTDYLDFLAEGNILLPGAAALCREIKALGCALYICTNGVTRVQKKRLAESEVASLCDGIFVSEEAGSQKPQKEYFDYVFAHIGEPDKARVLMVGDSLSSDIRGAVDYSLPCCWFNPEGLTTDLPVDYIVERLSEILPVIQGK